MRALDKAEFRHALSAPVDMGVLFLLPRYTETGVEIGWLNASFPERTPTMGSSSFVLKEFTIVK